MKHINTILLVVLAVVITGVLIVLWCIQMEIIVLIVSIVLLWSMILFTAFSRRSKSTSYQRIFDLSTECTFVCGRDGQIIHSSVAATSLLKADDLDIKGKPIFKFIDKPTSESFTNAFYLLRDKKDGGAKKGNCRIKLADNRTISVAYSINSLLHVPDINAVIIHMQNITKRIQKEKQQEDFVSLAVHELKNPITAIKGYVQLLKIQTAKEATLAGDQMVNKLDTQVNRVVNLMEQMLNLVKIKSGSLQCQFQPYDINYTIQEAIDAIRVTTNTHHIAATLNPTPIIVQMDELRITQVISNMLNNAIKYSPDGKCIKAGVDIFDQQIRFYVRDYGIGIRKKKQKKIFDRFYRADSLPDGKFDGLGLGLFICAQIIEQHGGKIGVESEEGAGAEFWFTLPIQ